MLRRFPANERTEVAEFYRREGYAVVTGLFTVTELEEIASEVYRLFEVRFAAEGIAAASPQALMVSQYASNRDLWRQCASKMWDVVAVLRSAAKPALTELLGALGLRRPIISTRPEVRTDMPGDEQFMQPWHQDWTYAQTSLNAVTVWTPLHDVTRANGAIDVIPASHLWGPLKSQQLTNPRRFVVTDDRLAGAEPVTVELRQGECVVFSHFLVHRSGRNSTQVPRLTFQARYADYLEPSFVNRGFPDSISRPETTPFTPDERQIQATFQSPVP